MLDPLLCNPQFIITTVPVQCTLYHDKLPLQPSLLIVYKPLSTLFRLPGDELCRQKLAV
jgi:hypothetical protein